jgi:carboxypeptidase Q
MKMRINIFNSYCFAKNLYIRNMKKFLFVFICNFLAICIYAQNVNFNSDSSKIRRIADEVMTNSFAYENLRFLCKKIGHRLSGSIGAEKAVNATKKMLIDAGADTVYLQPCIVPHWVRLSKEEGFFMVDGKKYPLQLTSLGNSEGSKNKMIGSSVVEVKSMNELHALGNAIKGKIVFFNIQMDPTFIGTFNAYGAAGIGRRSGPAQAAKYGAIAVMVRSLASNADDYPHTGMTRYNDSFPKIPAVAISTNNANAISKLIKEGKQVKSFFKNDCTLLAPVNSFNVIGELKGKELPKEIITVGGHLDSWDLAEGAQDDGAGIVQSIEVIRSLKKAGIQPKRTIRAVMYMNEENGSGGADAYLANAKLNKEQHIFAMESDAGGFTPRGFTLEMKEEQRIKIKSWAPLFYRYGVYDFREGGSGSDIDNLKELGTALVGLSPDSQRYFDLHHASTDVFEAVSKRELDLGAMNMTALIWLVSEYGL